MDSDPTHRPSLDEIREAALTAARSERDRFKRDVNLIAYAASRGYAFNKAKSSINFPALRHPTTGHKILVGKGKDGHWVYYSIGSEERGSIIDFIQHREGGERAYPITKVLQELRSWTNTPRELPVFARGTIPFIPKDRAAVAATVENGRVIDTHRYLESRGLSVGTLQHPRFRATWRQSGPKREKHDLPSGTVLFLHHDDQGLCGFETKHWRFTGFARGGTKALWWSGVTPTDSRLVIAESALDALSYHQVNAHPRARYVSFAGAMNASQPELLERAISWMPAGSTVVAATDRDDDGHLFAARIADLCAKHPHVTYERHAPTLGEKDRNDHLLELRKRQLAQDGRTVIAQDNGVATSHSAAVGACNTVYITDQRAIEKELARLPASSTVVIAANGDAAGRAFAERVSELAQRRPFLTVRKDFPTHGITWEGHLRERTRGRAGLER